jgi:hypothetical protein
MKDIKNHPSLLILNFFASDRANLSEKKVKEILEKYDYAEVIKEYHL